MTRLLSTRRPRAAAWCLVALTTALAAASATVPAPGAVAAEPARLPGDCAEPFPVADLTPGDPVEGSTVVSGTDPVPFTGEVLGVLDDGIAPGLDMVMAELDMPEFDRTDGIWAGMSGSPVYASDGRLIGAVAYGLSYGPTRVAGITPYAAMLADADVPDAPPPARVRVDRSTARLLAERTGLARDEVVQGFSELRMPFGVAGIGARQLERARTAAPRLAGRASYVLGRGSAERAGAETIVPGGNLAASISFGEITMAGVGTVTSLCRGRVLAFGHPLGLFGRTALGLHPADAVYIQPDSLGQPFKVANVSDAVGTIDRDRLTGISGSIGAVPPATVVTTDTRGPDSARVGTTQVLLPAATAEVTFYQLVAALSSALNDSYRGSADQSLVIRGTDGGEPFVLRDSERYASRDLAFEAAVPVAELVYRLTRLRGVHLDSVEVTTAVRRASRAGRVVALEQHSRDGWAPVGRRAGVSVQPGDTVRLRAVLAGAEDGTVLPFQVTVPPRAADGLAVLEVVGGTSVYSRSRGRSVSAIRAELRTAPRNDEVRVVLSSLRGERGPRGNASSGSGSASGGGGGHGIAGRRGPGLSEYERVQLLGPLAHVVRGGVAVLVRVGDVG